MRELIISYLLETTQRSVQDLQRLSDVQLLRLYNETRDVVMGIAAL